MNETNKTNAADPPDFFLSKDQWLTIFGSTWSLDMFMSYPYIIASILGFIFNSYSLAVFQDAEFNIDLYKYMRVYCVNNMAVCLFGAGNCFFATKRLLPWSNSYYTSAYSSFFYIPMMNVHNLNGSLIDIYILLDRIANFNNRVKAWINWPVYKTCIITFIACFLFNIPSFVSFSPWPVTVMLNSTSPFTIWLTGTSDYFGSNLIGKIWLGFFLAVRDFGVMAAQISLNLYSIVLLKQHLGKKRALHNSRVSPGNESIQTRSVMTQMNAVSIKRTEVNGSSTTTNSRRKEKISAADQRATVMAIVMCSLSVTEHLLFLIVQIIPYFVVNLLVTFTFIDLNNFYWSFKRCLDFPIFFFFNKNFKKICLSHLKLSWHCVSPLSVNNSLSAVAQARSLCHANATKTPSYLNLNTLKLGENVYSSWVYVPDSPSCFDFGIEAVKYWYAEASQYNFNNPRLTSAARRFTQLLWKSTTTFGAGFASVNGVWAESGFFEIYVASDYYPAGNIAGGPNNNQYFIQNVLPPTCKSASE